ncbi:hypothetical protein [Ectopseudomonas oleovorans]|uniref:hypothetical protein n=2 Tax=Ectopseudomonas oleovorans TaxID=301 RepID=UPI000CAB3A65|nr:hypothetical protein [Pseudomonas oleovorans]MBN7118825.1 hypothetical protein [Pseudomonas oleovorans]MBN7140782.1 hypothetical protein [Pseudomonas oleovorans]PKM32402.1 MAG: hypothetical protein CVV08_12595 [Gammaproteobacteria bacterium HGW-Gammaproteobacteria-12]
MLELLLRGLALLAEIVFEVIISYLLYTIGWLVLRLLTLGHYPRLPLRVADPMGARSAWVATFGFICLVGAPLTWLTVTHG